MPAKGCSGITGSSGCQCPSCQVNQALRAWSNTDTGRLKNFASSTPQPVPPFTVSSGWIQPTANTWYAGTTMWKIDWMTRRMRSARW